MVCFGCSSDKMTLAKQVKRVLNSDKEFPFLHHDLCLFIRRLSPPLPAANRLRRKVPLASRFGIGTLRFLRRIIHLSTNAELERTKR